MSSGDEAGTTTTYGGFFGVHTPKTYKPGSRPSDPVIVEHGRVLDLLCEGPIFGLSTGDLQSVYLDDVPCQNADGTTNLKDVYFAIVNGTINQPAIKGMSEVESEATIQSKVTVASPVTASLTNPSATACRVKISVPALYNAAAGTSINFRIDVNNGSGWVTKVFPLPALVGGATSLSINATAKTLVRASGDFSADRYFIGQVIRTYGWTNSGNNQESMIITGIPDTHTLEVAGAVGLVNESAGQNRWITGTTEDGALAGRFTSKYTKAFRIPLTGSGPWQIRLTRLTADSADPTTIQNDLYLESLTTIVEARLRNPHCAKIAVSVDAKQYSKIPTRSYLTKLKLIKVPRNYDPATRTYHTTGNGTTGGVWDGTFGDHATGVVDQLVWSDNPAWCFYDLATNTRYGAGSYLDAAKVDKWSLYTIAQYCDALVPDGKGGTEPRFRCNALINSRQEGIKLLNYLASVFRGMAYWASGVITAIQDVDVATPAALFTASNVVDGNFSYSGTARRARHTACLVYWNDPANRYKRTPEYVEDQVGIARYGLNQVEVTAFGCTSQGQARRLGLWTLACELLETETVTFKTGMKGVVARPGEVIQVQDQFRTGIRAGGRIVSATTTQVVLDAPVVLVPAVAYQISCTLPDGTVETRLITTAASTTATIDVGTAFSKAPQVQGQWVMVAGDGSMATELYRAISIAESEGVYEVTALLHDAAKYALIESGLVVTPGDPPAFDAHSPVLNLVASEAIKDVGGALLVALVAFWDPRPGALGYSAQRSLNDGPWQPMTVSGPSAELDGINLGTYRVRVLAHYPTGISDYADTTYTVTGSSVIGSAITGLTTVYSAGQSLLQWDAIAGFEYEIRLGASWDLAKVLGRTVNPWFATVSDGEYWVAARFANSYGTPDTVVVAGSTLTNNVVAAWDEDATGWPGTCSGSAAVHPGGYVTLVGSGLISEIALVSGITSLFALGDLGTDGYYEIPAAHVTDITVAQVCTLIANYQFAVENREDLVSKWALVSLVSSVGGHYTGLADVILESSTDKGSGYGAWVKFTPGQFLNQKTKWRAHLTSLQDQIAPQMLGLVTTTDMPDRVDKGYAGVICPAVGLTITYAIPFQIIPLLQITIVDAQAGDVPVIDSQSATACTIHCVNAAGTNVQRTVNVTPQGY